MSSIGPSAHTHPFYAMETCIKGGAFKGQFVIPPPPTTNIPSKLNHEALMALPLIGLWVGVDELVPSKNVFAIYDSGNCGLRYTHGDGTLIPPEQVLFSTKYKDPRTSNDRSQRVHFMALTTASMNHYEMINKDPQTRANLRIRYPTTDSVKKALTYHVDAPSSHNECQALQDIQENADPSFDYVSPAVEISSGPSWDFDPAGFQAYAPQNQANIFDTLYKNFQKSYRSPLDLMEFQHAVFCLAGLVRANLVSFVSEGQHDPRMFIPGQSQPLLPKPCLPLITTEGWTVDCFIARWHLFTKIFEPGKFIRYPNPILWLEAELDVEELLSSRGIGFQFTKPWKGKVDNVNVRPVLDWDILKTLRWQTRGGFNHYPKQYQSQGPQRSQPSSLSSHPASWPSRPPRLTTGASSTIEKPRSRNERKYHNPNESKHDRRVREEKEKLQKRTDKIKRYEYPDYQPSSNGLSYQGPEYTQSDNHRRVRESRKPRNLYEIPEYKGAASSSRFDQSDFQQMEEGRPLAEMTQLYHDPEGMGYAGPSNRKRPYGSYSYEHQPETYQQSERQVDVDYAAFEDTFDAGHSRKKSRSSRHPHRDSSNRKCLMPTINNLFASPGKNIQRMRTSEMLKLKKEKAQFESKYAYDGDFAGPFAGDFDGVMEPVGNNYESSSRSGFYPPSYAGPSRLVKKPVGHARAFEEALDTFERQNRVDPSDPRFLSTLLSPSIESTENQYLQPHYSVAPDTTPSSGHGDELSLNMQLVPSIGDDEESGSASAMEQPLSVGESVLPLLPSIEHRDEDSAQNDPDAADLQQLPPLVKQEDVSDRGATQLPEDAITLHSPPPHSPSLPAAQPRSTIVLDNDSASLNTGGTRSISFYREEPQRRLRIFERYSDTASFDNGATMGYAGPSFGSTIPDNSFATSSGASEFYSDQTIPNDGFIASRGENVHSQIPIEMITSASGVADLFSNQPVGSTSRRCPAKKTRRYSNSRAHPTMIDDSPPPSRHRRSGRTLRKLTLQSYESHFANSLGLFSESSNFHTSMTDGVSSFTPVDPSPGGAALPSNEEPARSSAGGHTEDPAEDPAGTSAGAEEEDRDVTPSREIASEAPDVNVAVPDAEATQALMGITPDVD